jgi:hypothetical protein
LTAAFGSFLAYHAEGIIFLPAEARFDYLLNRPEGQGEGIYVA